MGFELATSVVIGTVCKGNNKSNYHTITITTSTSENTLWIVLGTSLILLYYIRRFHYLVFKIFLIVLDCTPPTTEMQETTIASTTGGEELLHSTTLPTCTRKCSCPSNQTLSNEELLVKIAKLKTEISVDRKNTSKYRNTKLSVTDNRKSSRNLGILGIVVLVIPVLLVVINDLLTALKSIWRG